MPKPRGGTSYRFSEEAQDLLGQLAQSLGLSKTAVLELAIRKLARSEFPEGPVSVEYQPAQRGRPKKALHAPAAGA